jgi:hypothetical protein
MTTRQKRKTEAQFRGLKWLLVAGSVTAALMGSHLLAANDKKDIDPFPTATQEFIVVPARPQIPVQSGGQQLMPRQIELAPVPTAVAVDVRAVVRSRSSR